MLVWLWALVCVSSHWFWFDGYEVCHEIMVLFVLRKLILQTRMCSHPVGWMRRLVWAFAGRICDKYQRLMSWLICFLSYCSDWVKEPLCKPNNCVYLEQHRNPDEGSCTLKLFKTSVVFVLLSLLMRWVWCVRIFCSKAAIFHKMQIQWNLLLIWLEQTVHVHLSHFDTLKT